MLRCKTIRHLLFAIVFLIYGQLNGQTVVSQKGLTTVSFNYSDGIVKIFYPSNIVSGDKITVGFTIEAAGRNANQKQKSSDLLLKSQVTISDQKNTNQVTLSSRFNAISQTGLIPAFVVNSSLQISVSATKQQPQTIDIPLQLQADPRSSTCLIPSHILTESLLMIHGPFDGDASNTKCSLGNKEIPVIAESPRETFVSYPDVKGMQTLSVKEADHQLCAQQVSTVIMNVTAGKLNVLKGESTWVQCDITGLDSLQEQAILTVNNISGSVVLLEGGDLQIIPILPASITGKGTWQKKWIVQSVKTGSYTILFDIELPEPRLADTPVSKPRIDITLLPVQPTKAKQDTPIFTVPPGQTAKICDCTCQPSIKLKSKNGKQVTYSANVVGGCSGACGVGVNTFTKCELDKITYEWSITKGSDKANIQGSSSGSEVTININDDKADIQLQLNAATICKNCNKCTNSASVSVGSGGTSPTRTDKEKSDSPHMPTTTTEKTSSKCKCSSNAAIVLKTNNNGQIDFSVNVNGKCEGVYGTDGNFKPCGVASITYNWKVSVGNNKVVSISGAANKSGVTLQILGSGNYILNVTGTVTCNDGTTCDYYANYEGEIPPDDRVKSCFPAVKEMVEPLMDGGLKAFQIGQHPNENKTMNRDDFIALEADGADYDMLVFTCEKKNDCPDDGSMKQIALAGRVRFEWKIKTGDQGSFVKVGCLPDNDQTDKGEHVIFKPPVVPLPVKGDDTTIITTITLSVIDDGSAKPDPQVDKTITIKTKRVKAAPDKYVVDISGGKYTPVAEPGTKLLPGECMTNGPDWSQLDDLKEPAIQLPEGIPDNNKLVLGQWIVLTTPDQRDKDHAIFRCNSKSNCNTAPLEKDYEDNVIWDWEVVSGGGKILLNKTGRTLIYEAPLDMPKGQEEVEVKIKLTVRNPKGERKDAPKDKGEVILKVYQPGIKLSQTPLTWLPADDNNIEFTSQLMYKSGGKWLPSLAHMCRIHYLELLNVSEERGVCMNDPVFDKANTCRDLKLKKEDKHEPFDTSGPSACNGKSLFKQARTQQPVKEYKIKVYSLDFGSYGFFRSFANINKGGKDSIKEAKPPIYISIPVTKDDVTHPQGRPKKNVYGDNRVTIPYDVDENHICDDGYTVMPGVKIPDPSANDADDDDKPTGDGFKGDGLSTYEEYRGFKVLSGNNIIHIRTDYNKKDVFIRNENDLDISLYQTISELVVHEINKDQYNGDDKRVVNFNFNKSTNVVEQKGLHLVNKGSHPSLLGISCSIFCSEACSPKCKEGRPAPPNWMREQRIYMTNIRNVVRERRLVEVDKVAAVIAHELLHANNVCHHGEGDPEVENSFDLVGGLRSGDVSCVMRYDNIGSKIDANCVINSKAPAEAIGNSLCTSATGTGYNASTAQRPHGCFGDAAAKRGDCKHQIRVSGKGDIPSVCGNR